MLFYKKTNLMLFYKKTNLMLFYKKANLMLSTVKQSIKLLTGTRSSFYANCNLPILGTPNNYWKQNTCYSELSLKRKRKAEQSYAYANSTGISTAFNIHQHEKIQSGNWVCWGMNKHDSEIFNCSVRKHSHTMINWNYDKPKANLQTLSYFRCKLCDMEAN